MRNYSFVLFVLLFYCCENSSDMKFNYSCKSTVSNDKIDYKLLYKESEIVDSFTFKINQNIYEGDPVWSFFQIDIKKPYWSCNYEDSIVIYNQEILDGADDYQEQFINTIIIREQLTYEDYELIVAYWKRFNFRPMVSSLDKEWLDLVNNFYESYVFTSKQYKFYGYQLDTCEIKMYDSIYSQLTNKLDNKHHQYFLLDTMQYNDLNERSFNTLYFNKLALTESADSLTAKVGFKEYVRFR